MAMGADVIVAQPLTITGSIGVVLGKFNLEELYRRIGYTKTPISRGRSAPGRTTVAPAMHPAMARARPHCTTGTTAASSACLLDRAVAYVNVLRHCHSHYQHAHGRQQAGRQGPEAASRCGRYANLLGDSRSFTPDEEALFDATAEFAYRSFRDKAAASRGMAVERMQDVAQARRGGPAAVRALPARRTAAPRRPCGLRPGACAAAAVPRLLSGAQPCCSSCAEWQNVYP